VKKLQKNWLKCDLFVYKKQSNFVFSLNIDNLTTNLFKNSDLKIKLQNYNSPIVWFTQSRKYFVLGQNIDNVDFNLHHNNNNQI
jgi:hypothetical protein